MLAQVNGTELFFDVEGSGLVPDGPAMTDRIPCFVLHGGPALDHTYLRPWISPLAEQMQLIYVDHRGTGRSADADPSTYRLEVMADDLEALRQHLGLGKVAVMGSSYGGFLALTFAVKYPDSVSHLLAVGTAASVAFMAEAEDILSERGNDLQREIGPKLMTGQVVTQADYEHWWETMLPLYFRTPDDEIVQNTSRRMMGRCATALEMFRNDMPNFDVEEELGSIEVPTFVAGGAHDWVTPPSQSQLIAEKIRGAQLVIYENSGHFVFIEEQDKFIHDVRQFLAGADKE